MKSFVLLFIATFAIACAVAAKAPRPERPDYITWKSRYSTLFIDDMADNFPGEDVYVKCMEHWLWHAQERQMTVQNTPCPFGPFAADIVDHTIKDATNVHIDGHDCGKWIEGNTGERGANVNPIEHAEVQATYRLMNCTLHPENCATINGKFVQTQAQNKTYFGKLTMYSTGESCAMDATSEILAGYGAVIYGFSTKEQIKAGWPLPETTSKEIYDNSRTPTVPFVVMSNVQIERYRPLYSWQFQSNIACPTGCARPTTGAGCVKTA